MKLGNLHMLIKQRVYHFPETWFVELLVNSVLNTGKSATPSLFNGLEVLSSASDKAKLFSENFSRTLTPILMTQASLYLFSLLEVI